MPAIRSVTVTEFEFVPSGQTNRTLRKFAVQIAAADGNIGEYVALWSAPPLAVPQVLAGVRLILGHDYRDRERLWDKVNRAHAKHDRIGYGSLDIALWDLAGKAVGQPIWALLGRHRDRLPAYVSTVSGTKGSGSLGSPAAYADYCVSLGVLAYKFHGFSGASARDEIDASQYVGLALRHDPRADIVGEREHRDGGLADCKGGRRNDRRQQPLETLSSEASRHAWRNPLIG